MRVLVIGATGSVGRAVTRELRSNSLEIIAVGGPHSAAGIKNGHRGEALFANVDITNTADLERLARVGEVDAVVHAAGLAHEFSMVTDAELYKVNVLGTENVARLAVKLNARHLLLISSVLVYGGHGRGILTEDDVCTPSDTYAQSKLASEKAAISICEHAGLPLTILRPAPIIGEGSRGNFLKLVRMIARGRFIWIGNGQNLKSLVSVDDVAKAVASLVRIKKSNTEIFNVSGPAITMSEIVSVIADRLGTATPRFSIPKTPVETIAATIASRLSRPNTLVRASRTLEKFLSDDVYSAERIRDKYGWAAESDPAEAIRSEVAYIIYNK